MSSATQPEFTTYFGMFTCLRGEDQLEYDQDVEQTVRTRILQRTYPIKAFEEWLTHHMTMTLGGYPSFTRNDLLALKAYADELSDPSWANYSTYKSRTKGSGVKTTHSEFQQLLVTLKDHVLQAALTASQNGASGIQLSRLGGQMLGINSSLWTNASPMDFEGVLKLCAHQLSIQQRKTILSVPVSKIVFDPKRQRLMDCINTIELNPSSSTEGGELVAQIDAANPGSDVGAVMMLRDVMIDYGKEFRTLSHVKSSKCSVQYQFYLDMRSIFAPRMTCEQLLSEVQNLGDSLAATVNGKPKIKPTGSQHTFSPLNCTHDVETRNAGQSSASRS